jgi:N-sulfoglucosamine sulfohydrolase
MKTSTLSLCGFLLALNPLHANPARPNILWLVGEDASADWFGCYGNKRATTPHIDALARQGFRYTHAYACAPVCAPSRSTWITGRYAISMGTQPMRSRFAIPLSATPYYPDQLRKTGYFAANFKKTDYNIGNRADPSPWDATADNAWTRRANGQPFFQVLNFEDTHESKAFGDVETTRHAPEGVTLRSYHPDDPVLRKNYAKYEDAVENLDTKVGLALARLEAAGLAEDTIVIFNTDHGGVMPRSKRWLYNSGTHCPLIIRIPEKFKHLWPADAPGATIERLVGFIDFPKTWLSLAQAEVPASMQGRIFLGPNAEPEPDCVYGFRERMDERFDSQRSVRTKKFVYIQNEMPNVPWGQNLEYIWKMPAMQAWEKAHQQGRTDSETGRFFGIKPVEELYDTQSDPDNVRNLAGEPAHQATLLSMRSNLRDWRVAVRDTGLLPEGERARRAAARNLTIAEMAADRTLYPLEKYLVSSELALRAANDATTLNSLIALTRDADSGQRYWGAYGLLFRKDTASATPEWSSALETLLSDECPEVRSVAAWALLHQKAASPAAQKALRSTLAQDPAAALFALNILAWTKENTAPYADLFEPLLASKDPVYSGYIKRMVTYLREMSAQ